MTDDSANAATTAAPSRASSTADTLNRDCQCRTLDLDLLRGHLERDPLLSGLLGALQDSRPSLFAATAVFISADVLARIQHGIRTIEQVIALPGYQSSALSRAPQIARRNFGQLGAFTSCDFHVGPQGPRLIEINSNAGGALLAAAVGQAQLACCEPMCGTAAGAPAPQQAEQRFVNMFRSEWQLQRHGAELARLLIVDDEPATQYLAPEFELFCRLFERHGIAAAIADAAELEHRGGRLWFAGEPIDMVYNRLTDFYLEEPRHAPLREAWLAGNVVITPQPRTHALYADKRNLVTLGDDALLQSWGVSAADRQVLLDIVPRSWLVTPENATQLWARRKSLFFKPAGGFGARAAWRGDKITRRAWSEVIAGTYIAQDIVPPAERLIPQDGDPTRLKFDLRAYTYAGGIQLLSARMYAGQTTNFRTPGGGFAAVIVTPIRSTP